MARALDMVVQPVLAEMLPGGQGYRVDFLPPWTDWPERTTRWPTPPR